MNIDKTLYIGRPHDKRSPVEMAVYDLLDSLCINYVRVDHDHADNMDDCLCVEEVLGTPVCKNLLLCNRQKTEFYMLAMPGDKPFKTKHLTSQLGCARLSFANAEDMDRLLKTTPGSVSILELMNDTEKKVRLLIDSELMGSKYISGHPGISTSTLRIRLVDILEIFLPAVSHEYTIVDLPRNTD